MSDDAITRGANIIFMVSIFIWLLVLESRVDKLEGKGEKNANK